LKLSSEFICEEHKFQIPIVMNKKYLTCINKKLNSNFFFLNEILILVYNYLSNKLISVINFGFYQDTVNLIQTTVNMLNLELILETSLIPWKFASKWYISLSKIKLKKYFLSFNKWICLFRNWYFHIPTNSHYPKYYQPLGRIPMSFKCVSLVYAMEN